MVTKQIFVNLPVKDLKVSMDFFAELSFTFNPKFTDKNAACMLIGENIYAMLLVEEFFKGFTKKEINDTKKNNEVILALSANSKEEVDEMYDAALAAGGKMAYAPADHGWMYSKSFEDPDGHIWEMFWMNESLAPQNMS